MWPVLLAQVLPHPQLIFPSKTWFLGIYLNFQQQKSLKNQYFLHSESKSYQINSIKILLINIFPTTPKAHSNSSKKFQLRFNLIFNEKIIQYSRTFAPQVQTTWNQAHARAFQRHQEHDLKHPRLVDLITTKQNKAKQITFLHR